MIALSTNLRSSLRRDLLSFFLANRSARVYVRQLATILGVDSTNLSRELARLESDGLLQSEIEGRQRYYSINRDYPYLKPLFAMLQGLIGIEPTLRKALAAIRGIESASIYGSFAKQESDATSDIDLLILGQPNHEQLSTEIRRAEKILHREINYTVLQPSELKEKLARHDPFVSDIWNGKRIELNHDEAA
jgi:predicted nucleotidyltransferase